MVKIKRGLLGELGEIHQRMERMMQQVLHRHRQGGMGNRPDWCPAADLYETETEVLILLEVAGVDPASLEIVLEDEILRVSGMRRDLGRPAACVALHQVEIEYGPFERHFAVPLHLQGEAGQARLEDGFLEIRIPKAAAGPGASRVEIVSG